MLALRAVWKRGQDQALNLHADLKATLYNAHFNADGIAWIAADFLGTGDREKRKAEKFANDRAVIQENTRLMRIKRGAPPTDDVPAWAIGAYRG